MKPQEYGKMVPISSQSSNSVLMIPAGPEEPPEGLPEGPPKGPPKGPPAHPLAPLRFVCGSQPV